jgi:ketosteroid isomerase-like protein
MADTISIGLKFDNTYARCMRFDESGTIVEVRAYLDSWMVKQAIEENEVPSNRAPVPSLH